MKTNEVPVAQEELIPPLDLEGRFVSLDALHTMDETARRVVMEGGGIESGLHQRLDISHNEDRCRVQSRQGMWI